MVLERKDIDKKYKWDLTVIYKAMAAFEADFALAQKKLKEFSKLEKTMTKIQTAIEQQLKATLR